MISGILQLFGLKKNISIVHKINFAEHFDENCWQKNIFVIIIIKCLGSGDY